MLGGIPIRLEASAPTKWRLAPVGEARPELRVRITEVRSLPSPRGTRLFDGPRFWVWQDTGFLELHLLDLAGQPRIAARWKPCEELVVVSCLPALAADQELRDEILPELLVAHLAPARGLAYLHAAGTLGPGGVRLFLGPSGEGKSTAAGLLVEGGHRLFAADRCAAWVEDRPRVASVPWHGGSAGVGDPADLAALFVLCREGQPGIRRLEGAQALAAVAANAFLPRWWPEGLEAALEAIHRVTARTPVFALCSEPDARLVHRVERAIEVARA
jgi:hypothetical protein